MIKTRFKALMIKHHHQLLALGVNIAVNIHISLGHLVQKVDDWMDIVS